DRYLDEDVHRDPFAPRRVEPPLFHRADRALVEPRAEALQHVHLADAAVAPHDDLEQHVARDAAPPRVLCIFRLHLVKQPRRLDAAAWPVRPAAGASARAVADPGSEAFAVAGTLAGSDAAVGAGPVAVPPFHRMFYRTFAVASIRRD